MDIFTVSLFGHRKIEDLRQLETRLSLRIKEILQTKSHVTFLIGRNGEFDIYAASVIKRLQKEMGTVNHMFVCVLPYSDKDMAYYEAYYDSVILPACIGKPHPKRAITERNRWMTEQSDLFLCYVEHKKGGAYAALKYAKKLNKQIINLAEKDPNNEK